MQRCCIHHTGIYTWSAGVIKDGKVYLLGDDDELYLPKEFFMATYECEGGLIQFHVDRKWGFADIYTGKIKIEPVWDYAGPFYGGFAHVALGVQVEHGGGSSGIGGVGSEGGKHGYIDTKGDIVVPLEYDLAEEIPYRKNFIVAKNGKWGLVNRHNIVLIPSIWHHLGRGLYFYNLLFCSRVVENHEKQEIYYGVYDQNFNMIVEPEVEEFIHPVIKETSNSRDYTFYKKYLVLKIKRKYGIISNDGRMIANIVLSKKQATMLLNAISRELSGDIYIDRKIGLSCI